MWVLIDNYDSFTYILHHYLLQLHKEVVIFRNDAITIEELRQLNPERIIISPGPKTPLEAGITNDVILHFHQLIPILGICLGHQALGMYLGASLTKAIKPAHGRTSRIIHQNIGLFNNIPQNFKAMRYHSLILKDWNDKNIVPLAFSEENELMAFRHLIFPLVGVQFHPESILTQHGLLLLQNWVKLFN